MYLVDALSPLLQDHGSFVNDYYRSLVAKLSYTVQVDKKMLLSWETQPLPVDDVTDAVDMETNGMLAVFTDQTVALSELYLNGESREIYKKSEKIKSSITTAWSSVNNGKNIFVGLTHSLIHHI